MTRQLVDKILALLAEEREAVITEKLAALRCAVILVEVEFDVNRPKERPVWGEGGKGARG